MYLKEQQHSARHINFISPNADKHVFHFIPTNRISKNKDEHNSQHKKQTTSSPFILTKKSIRNERTKQRILKRRRVIAIATPNHRGNGFRWESVGDSVDLWPFGASWTSPEANFYLGIILKGDKVGETTPFL